MANTNSKIEWMTTVRPYISAVGQSVDELAARAWQTLRQRITGEDTDLVRVLLDFRFVFRESTRPPKLVALAAAGGRAEAQSG